MFKSCDHYQEKEYYNYIQLLLAFLEDNKTALFGQFSLTRDDRFFLKWGVFLVLLSSFSSVFCSSSCWGNSPEHAVYLTTSTGTE